MNYDIFITDIDQFFGARVNGIWKLEHSEKLASELLEIHKVNGLTDVLIDHSNVMINIPYFVAFRRPSQLKTLFEDIRPRIAFIPPKGRHRLYHFFESVARNRGIDFRIFPNEETAVDWLKNKDLD